MLNNFKVFVSSNYESFWQNRFNVGKKAAATRFFQSPRLRLNRKDSSWFVLSIGNTSSATIYLDTNVLRFRRSDRGCIEQWLAYLLPDSAALGSIPSVTKLLMLLILSGQVSRSLVSIIVLLLLGGYTRLLLGVARNVCWRPLCNEVAFCGLQRTQSNATGMMPDDQNTNLEGRGFDYQASRRFWSGNHH